MANKRTVSILILQKVSTFDFDPKNAPYKCAPVFNSSSATVVIPESLRQRNAAYLKIEEEPIPGIDCWTFDELVECRNQPLCTSE